MTIPFAGRNPQYLNFDLNLTKCTYSKEVKKASQKTCLSMKKIQDNFKELLVGLWILLIVLKENGQKANLFLSRLALKVSV